MQCISSSQGKAAMLEGEQHIEVACHPAVAEPTAPQPDIVPGPITPGATPTDTSLEGASANRNAASLSPHKERIRMPVSGLNSSTSQSQTNNTLAPNGLNMSSLKRRCNQVRLEPHNMDTPECVQDITGSSSVASHDPNLLIRQAMSDMSQDASKILLVSVLGKGACGTVYRGLWRGMAVAVKTVLFSMAPAGNDVAGRAEGQLSGQAAQAQVIQQDQAVTEAAVCLSVMHRNVVSRACFQAG